MGKAFRELYLADMERYKNDGTGIKAFLRGTYTRKFHYFLRKCQTARNPLSKNYYKLRFLSHCRSHHLEISPSLAVGKGLFLGHPFCITINSDVVIGENCNIHKGVTIGQENRGARKGTPTIGNMVWIGINSTVVGKITIGDDVLIAPNAYVNCDVPSHSIVLGNPCVIRHRDNATENYIDHRHISDQTVSGSCSESCK